jgi:hypothetical protein
MKYLIPRDLRAEVEDILVDTRKMVAEVLDLDLRVGLVSAAKIYAANRTLAIARLRVSERYTQVMVTGTGLAFAEALVKHPKTAARYTIPKDRKAKGKADFAGYTCRWQDIPSSKGETIALIVKAARYSNSDAILQAVMERVRQIFGVEESYHPLTEENLRLARSGDRIETEAKVLSKKRGGLLFLLKSLSVKLQVWFVDLIVRRNVSFRFRGKNLRDVRKDNILSSDFRKYDGTLKMVISGTPESRQMLVEYLEDLNRGKRIFYGIHVSDRALLTCLIQYGSQSEVHFVDAADGGYALAAKRMKKQIALAKAT